jgi:hypothetical protein
MHNEIPVIEADDAEVALREKMIFERLLGFSLDSPDEPEVINETVKKKPVKQKEQLTWAQMRARRMASWTPHGMEYHR